MYKDKKILKYTQCQNIDNFFFLLQDKEISKYFDTAYFFKLKRNCIFYKISMHNLQKIFLKIKKFFDLAHTHTKITEVQKKFFCLKKQYN